MIKSTVCSSVSPTSNHINRSPNSTVRSDNGVPEIFTNGITKGPVSYDARNPPSMPQGLNQYADKHDETADTKSRKRSIGNKQRKGYSHSARITPHLSRSQELNQQADAFYQRPLYSRSFTEREERQLSTYFPEKTKHLSNSQIIKEQEYAKTLSKQKPKTYVFKRVRHVKNVLRGMTFK